MHMGGVSRADEKGRRKSAFFLKLVERLVTSSQMRDSRGRWEL